MITKELFDLTQLAFRKDNKPKHITAREFLFSGMVKCANCGCNISGEIKKGKYIYYSCIGGKGECKQQHIYIPEIKLEKQIIEAMGEIYITQEHKQWILLALRECFVDEQKYMQEQLNSLNTKKTEIKSKN